MRNTVNEIFETESLMTRLIENPKNYSNADRKCNCSKCEIKQICQFHDKHLRLPREEGCLDECHKLSTQKFRQFVSRYLEEYQSIVNKRN